MASEDDFSDLTDLESDDYTESKNNNSKKKSSKGGRKSGSGYRIKNALKVPRATTYTAQALYGKSSKEKKVLIFWGFSYFRFFVIEQIHSCDINLEPEYQRGTSLLTDLPGLRHVAFSYLFFL